MPLNAELLRNIADESGGRVVLIVGAGCSIDHPTNLELSRDLSSRMHSGLVTDGILDGTECADPTDLSLLADAVHDKTDGQIELVRRFPIAEMRLARPNSGHLLAAAMLVEGAIGHVLTLNFDLAMTNALTEIGAGTTIEVIAGQQDFARVGRQNLIYLHRNVDAPHSEWILRTVALDEYWIDSWQDVLATKVLSVPVTIFAGLGSPARVLTDTVGRIRNAVPEASFTYLVDPADDANSSFARALGVDDDSIIAMTWVQFMAELSDRVVIEQKDRLESACRSIVADEGWEPEDVPDLCRRFCDIGLLQAGYLRSRWILDRRKYAPEGSDDNRAWLADLLMAVGLAERKTDTKAVFFADGVVEFRRDQTILGSVKIAHGRGHYGLIAVEAKLEIATASDAHDPKPDAILVAGVTDNRGTHVAPPRDIVVTNEQSDNLVAAPKPPEMITTAELRADPERWLRILVPDG